MNEFYKKWKEDKRYRTKIKLIAYTAFVLIISAYALSINNNIPTESNNTIQNNNQLENQNYTINIPKNYTYEINITINNTNYQYTGEKRNNEELIKKETPTSSNDYRYFNNEYYILVNDNYQLTTKEDIYDIINYNYLSLETINKYLSKAEKIQNQYHVYIKDVILGNESNKYFIINLNNNHISIDYTPLINEFDNSIQNYIVDIKYETKE